MSDTQLETIKNMEDDIIKDHINTLVMTGEVTVDNPDSPRDLQKYLRSAKFAQFKQSLYMMFAKIMASQASSQPQPEQ